MAKQTHENLGVPSYRGNMVMAWLLKNSQQNRDRAQMDPRGAQGLRKRDYKNLELYNTRMNEQAAAMRAAEYENANKFATQEVARTMLDREHATEQQLRKTSGQAEIGTDAYQRKLHMDLENERARYDMEAGIHERAWGGAVEAGDQPGANPGDAESTQNQEEMADDAQRVAPPPKEGNPWGQYSPAAMQRVSSDISRRTKKVVPGGLQISEGGALSMYSASETFAAPDRGGRPKGGSGPAAGPGAPEEPKPKPTEGDADGDVIPDKIDNNDGLPFAGSRIPIKKEFGGGRTRTSFGAIPEPERRQAEASWGEHLGSMLEGSGLKAEDLDESDLASARTAHLQAMFPIESSDASAAFRKKNPDWVRSTPAAGPAAPAGAPVETTRPKRPSATGTSGVAPGPQFTPTSPVSDEPAEPTVRPRGKRNAAPAAQDNFDDVYD